MPLAPASPASPVETVAAATGAGPDVASLSAEQLDTLADFVDPSLFAECTPDDIVTTTEADQPALPDSIDPVTLTSVDHELLGGDNLTAVRAGDPSALAAHRQLEAIVMAGTATLTEADRTLIGLVVALENGCGYWQVHLRRRLEAWFDSSHVDAVASDWTTAGLDVRTRALLAFTVKLALIPGQMAENDARLLGSVGFANHDLVDIVDVVAYWSYATRIADGLGLFVEEPWLDT